VLIGREPGSDAECDGSKREQVIRLLKDYPLYQLKVELKGSQPAIWRRFQVKAETTLFKLHRVLQVVMGWHNYHLHEFRIGDLSFGEPGPELGLDFIDERKVRLTQIAPNGRLSRCCPGPRAL